MQRFLRFGLKAFVSDEELTIHEVDVGFDTAKAVVQRIEQWAFVFIIIVGVAMDEWSDCLFPTRAVNDLARFGVGVFAILEHLDAVHKDVTNTSRVLMRPFKGRVVFNFSGIEDDDIGEAALLERAAVAQFEIFCGQAA